MSGPNLIAREAEIIHLLGEINGSSLKYSVIGGYGVDAYSPLPRYSVDCDIVTEEKEVKSFADLLKTNGFTTVETIYRNEIEGIQIKSYIKNVVEGPVTCELFVEGVKCRQTEAVWRAQEIIGTSSERSIVCVNDTVLAKVASREMLIALKLHSGRDTDRKDVVMLAEDADWEVIRKLCDRGDKTKLKSQLEAAVAALGTADFEGTMKSAFGSKQNQTTRITNAASKTSDLLKEFS